MYAHQVIEAIHAQLESLPAIYTTKSYLVSCLRRALELFGIAQQFHAPEREELSNNFKHIHGSRVLLDHCEYVRLPYDVCWFDYESKVRVKKIPIGKSVCTKTGLMVSQFKQNEDLVFEVMPFFYFKDYHKWTIAGQIYVASVGKLARENDLFIAIMRKIYGDRVWEGIDKNNILPIPLMQAALDPDLSKLLIDDDAADLAHLAYVLMLLNCKNITTEKIDPPEKLNRKRSYSKKPPLFSYHILKIKAPSSKKTAKSLPTGEHNRIHFCRGHFKEYTSENPLFGKHTGLWWWQAHVRGQNREGFVGKDYEF